MTDVDCCGSPPHRVPVFHILVGGFAPPAAEGNLCDLSKDVVVLAHRHPKVAAPRLAIDLIEPEEYRLSYRATLARDMRHFRVPRTARPNVVVAAQRKCEKVHEGAVKVVAEVGGQVLRAVGRRDDGAIQLGSVAHVARVVGRRGIGRGRQSERTSLSGRSF